MTFTYSLTTDTGKVRLKLGDTTSGSGVRADGSNLTDEEIGLFLTEEGSVDGAIAAACEMLSRDWARAASYTIGPRSEQLGKVSAEWAARAAEVREKSSGQWQSFSIGAKRTDGYSEAANA